MTRRQLTLGFLAGVCFAGQTVAWAGQAPGASFDPDVAVSHRDWVYSAEQFSNTVSVTDPVDNRLVGVIRLGAIRQVVHGEDSIQRRYLVIAEAAPTNRAPIEITSGACRGPAGT